jgi:hypothetical protein
MNDSRPRTFKYFEKSHNSPRLLFSNITYLVNKFNKCSKLTLPLLVYVIRLIYSYCAGDDFCSLFFSLFLVFFRSCLISYVFSL